jgi:hypothetical protein
MGGPGPVGNGMFTNTLSLPTHHNFEPLLLLLLLPLLAMHLLPSACMLGCSSPQNSHTCGSLHDLRKQRLFWKLRQYRPVILGRALSLPVSP